MTKLGPVATAPTLRSGPTAGTSLTFVAGHRHRGADGWRSRLIHRAVEAGVKILLIEDDKETSAYIARGLREQAYVVDVAATGHDGLLLATEGHDVLIVDRMLPGLDGIGLVQALRQTGVKAPVLFLTALGGVGDRVRGLEAGGDDYLVKPFAFAELLARVNALARRPPLSDTPTVCALVTSS